MPKFLKLIKIILTTGAVFLLLLIGWFTFEFISITGTAQEVIEFEVKEGQSVAQIADALNDAGLLARKWPFLVGYRLLFSGKSLKAGEYRVEAPLSPRKLLHIFVEGSGIILHPVTIPEGLTRREIARHLRDAQMVDAASFLLASQDPGPIKDWDDRAPDLEGFLFPETYHFPKAETSIRMVEAMVNQFKQTFSEAWRQRAEELGMTVRDVVILASLIEKETSRPEERALVSAVFHNRLRIGMKLDCDPTIVYALKMTDSYTGRLRYRDLKLDSPYNTYLYPGLPPGPIANPGRQTLEAALYPAEVDFLYFVSRNDGTHHFSRTLREHQNAVNRYQRRSGR
jgi:UPF0755 protein